MRIDWMDHLRGFGIFLVVLGHTPGLPDFLEKLMFSFHMPLFFWISGMMCRESVRHTAFSEYVRDRARGLLIPYAIYSVISYGLWLILLRHFGTQATHGVSAWIPLAGIFYGNGIHFWLVHNTVLWFFLCLFVTELMFFFILRLGHPGKMAGVLMLLSLIGYLDVWLNPPVPSVFRLPWNMDIALTAVVFYGAGYLYARVHPPTDRGVGGPRTAWGLMWVTGFVWVFLSLINDRVALVAGVYGNYVYFYGAAFAGILFWQQLFHRLSGFWNGQLLARAGRNTREIFALHLLIFPFLTGIQVYVFRIPAEAKQDSVFLSLIYTLTAMAVLLMFSEWLKKNWHVLSRRP